ncbi:MAG TPA: DNA polymerase III subunit gamma/tau [Gammaproteobacteria bacterium]|nr:DNA polymerase III subunit gamma/tau [Gammaproteobacteria bacterium]
MTYEVLARKWRPKTFAEMVGQSHVLRALTNALDQNRVHHALLFTGTRGVGKTTLARILAKSLNCEEGVSSTPCGKCSACVEVDEGRFIDLIEVDAASRTKVEDTRDLLENVQYAPSCGRYKVYLIDEVHMLSDKSFNALLKTLEEPPPHVKFLLATTDPQKLPVTVLSRCLQFNLKRIPEQWIAEHLQNIMDKEGIAYEMPALQSLARVGDGSMRDALSLLDQAIAHCGGKLVADQVSDMLGTIDQQYVQDLARALASADGSQVMKVVAALSEKAPDYAAVLDALNSLFHRIALAQWVPDALDEGYGDVDAIRQLAGSVLPEDVQLFYQIGLIGRRDLSLAPDPRGGFEMVLLRMLAFQPDAALPVTDGQGAVAKQPQQAAAATSASASAPASHQAQSDSTAAPLETDYQPKASATEPVSPPPVVEVNDVAESVGGPETSPAPMSEWETLVSQLPLKGPSKELALHCVLAEKTANKIVLTVDASHNHLNRKTVVERLEKALRTSMGSAINLVINVGDTGGESPTDKRVRQKDQAHQASVKAIEQDPLVQDLQKVLGAEVDASRITPRES